jgi:acetyl/propionyl-CoA carboxylase alpha subunit
MRVVRAAAELADAVTGAKRESKAAFGDDTLLLEKYLQQPRHVEIQVFADTHGNCVYLFERDCSLQRRHQKVIEEAPAPALSDELRKRGRNRGLPFVGKSGCYPNHLVRCLRRTMINCKLNRANCLGIP